MSLRKLPSRVLLALSLSALALPFGCNNDREPTGVRLVLTSELSEGKSGNVKEIDYVQIDWDRSGNAGTVSEGQLKAGDELGIPQFPASLTFYDEPKDSTEPTDDRLQLKITAFLTGATPKKIERRVQVKFIDQVTQRLIVPLQFSCVDRTDCDNNSTATCIDGECVPVKEEPAREAFDEGSNNAEFSPPLCFNAATDGCFAGAGLVKAIGIRTDPENTSVCDFNIPNKTSADLDFLNVGIIWAEANGRYTVLDQDQNKGTQVGWKGVSSKVKGTNSESIRVTLPPHVCKEHGKGNASRVKGAVFAFANGKNECRPKKPETRLCGDATRSTSSAGLACEANTGGAVDVTVANQACIECLIKDDAGQTCIADPSCQAIALCEGRCRALNPKVPGATKPEEAARLKAIADCIAKSKCAEIESCTEQSRLNAQAALAAAKDEGCVTLCAGP